MSNTSEGKNSGEFIRLLEESRILRSEQLEVARGLLPETPSGTMLARRLVAKGILTTWQASKLLSGWTRLRLGNYKLCRQIDYGGFGRVFLAEHVQLQREVTVRTLPRHLTQQPEILDRFLADARRVAALNHRNLVHVLDIDRAADRYYVVMEYILGQDLQRLVEQKGPFPPGDAVGYLCQVADGLDYAHQAGVFHQDLRPANLICDAKSTIKILALGLTELTGGGGDAATSDANATRDADGDYRAPEQRDGDTPGDARSDIYSLGCTANYLLTGQPPTVKALDAYSQDALPHDIPFSRGEVPSEVPGTLAEIVQRMVAVEPQRRYESAQAVSAALGQWLQENPNESHVASLSAGPEGVVVVASRAGQPGDAAVSLTGSKQLEVQDESQRSRSGLQSRRWPVGPLAAVAAAGCFIAVLIFLLWPQQPRPIASGANSKKTVDAADASKSPVRKREKGDHGPGPAVRTSTLPKPGEGHPTSEPVTPKESSGAATGTGTPAKKAAPVSPGAAKPKAKVPSTKKQSPGASEADPFQHLPAAIDLSPPGRLRGVDPPPHLNLGPMTPLLARKMKVSLLGGAHAASKSGRFSLLASPAGDPPTWTFLLHADGETEQKGLAIAQLKVHDRQLRFTWNAVGVQHTLSTNLRNCVLRFAAQKRSHDLRLRTVKLIEPLRVDLSRQVVIRRWPVRAPPNPQYVRFEVTSLEDPFPKVYDLNPLRPIVADDETLLIQLGGKDVKSHILFLQLTPQLQSRFCLDCKASFQVGPQMERKPLTEEDSQVVMTMVAAANNAANAELGGVQTALNKLPEWDPNRNRLQQQRAGLQATLQEIRKVQARIQSLQQLCRAMANGAAVHFRLYYVADDCEVDLLRTASRPSTALPPDAR